MSEPVNYDKVAPDYDCRYKQNEYGGVERALLKFVSKGNAINVLDVGCGTGFWLKVVADRGFAVAGLDTSKKMLQQARTRLPNTSLVYGYAEALPWRDGAFDRVFCVNSFHHFGGKQAFLHEARRVLQTGGGLMILGLDPHTGLDRWWIYDYYPQVLDIDKERYPPTQAIRTWMSQLGFERCHSAVAQHMSVRVSAREAMEQGQLDKNSTSQLTLLDDTEYERGMNQLARDIKAAEAQNKRLKLVAELRLFVTVGWACSLTVSASGDNQQ